MADADRDRDAQRDGLQAVEVALVAVGNVFIEQQRLLGVRSRMFQKPVDGGAGSAERCIRRGFFFIGRRDRDAVASQVGVIAGLGLGRDRFVKVG